MMGRGSRSRWEKMEFERGRQLYGYVDEKRVEKECVGVSV